MCCSPLTIDMCRFVGTIAMAIGTVFALLFFSHVFKRIYMNVRGLSVCVFESMVLYLRIVCMYCLSYFFPLQAIILCASE